MAATFARYSGVLAAVIFFFSWLVSNTFLLRAQEDRDSMDAIESERRQLEQFSALSLDHRALSKSVASLRINLKRVSARAENSEAEASDVKSEAEDLLTWINAVQSDFGELDSSADQLKALAGRVPVDDVIRQSVEGRVKRAKELAAQFKRESEEYEREVGSLVSARGAEQVAGGDGEAGGEEANAGEADKRSAQIADHAKKVDEAERRLGPANEELLAGYDEVYGQAEVKRERSAARAETASRLAYVFSALATVIALAGRWLEDGSQRNPPRLL